MDVAWPWQMANGPWTWTKYGKISEPGTRDNDDEQLNELVFFTPTHRRGSAYGARTSAWTLSRSSPASSWRALRNVFQMKSATFSTSSGWRRETRDFLAFWQIHDETTFAVCASFTSLGRPSCNRSCEGEFAFTFKTS